MVVLTETGSWSGSVNYTDIATGEHSVEFKSQHTIYTNEYTVIVNPEEYNHSINYSLRCFPNNSALSMPQDSASILSNPYMCDDFTGSLWNPYVTEIHLYKEGEFEEPIITGKLPKPVMISPNVTTVFKLRLDI